MTTPAIILARGGSKGIPGKNIMPFCGKPLIAWSIEQAKAASQVDEVWVSSENEDILAVARAQGAECLVRPDQLATDTADSEGALIHFLESWKAAQGQGRFPERVVFLQTTSPLRRADDIDKAIQTYEQAGADSLFSASLLEDYCIWDGQPGSYRSITYDYRNRGRRQERDPVILENGSIYIFRPDILISHRNRLGGKIAVHLMQHWQSYQIDDPSDVDVIRWQFLRHRLGQEGAAGQPLSADEIDLVVYDFDGVMTDNTATVSQDGTEQVRINRSDGLGVKAIRDLGLRQLILSTEANPVVRVRAEKLGLDVSQDCADKADWLSRHCAGQAIALERVLYVGNDVNDLAVMTAVGWPVCPADAHPEIRSLSRIVLDRRGGDGVVQELAFRLDGKNLSHG